MFKSISKRKFNKVSQIKEIYKQAYTYSMNANNVSFKLAAFLGYLQSIIENDKFLSENYFKILLINKSCVSFKSMPFEVVSTTCIASLIGFCATLNAFVAFNMLIGFVTPEVIPNTIL